MKGFFSPSREQKQDGEDKKKGVSEMSKVAGNSFVSCPVMITRPREWKLFPPFLFPLYVCIFEPHLNRAGDVKPFKNYI